MLVFYFTFMSQCTVTNFFVIKPTKCTNFTNLFCHETLHVSDRFSAHHQEFIHCKLSNGVSHTSSSLPLLTFFILPHFHILSGNFMIFVASQFLLWIHNCSCYNYNSNHFHTCTILENCPY
jgi:hypothetical protein